jgi:hypothetical protein
MSLTIQTTARRNFLCGFARDFLENEQQRKSKSASEGYGRIVALLFELDTADCCGLGPPPMGGCRSPRPRVRCGAV